MLPKFLMNGLNVKVMCNGKIAHKERKCIYSKQLKFVAVFANGLDEPKDGEISVVNKDSILCSGFKKSISINTTPDGYECTSIIIYYNEDNLSDIFSIINLENRSYNYHQRLNTINKSLKAIKHNLSWWAILPWIIVIAMWLNILL